MSNLREAAQQALEALALCQTDVHWELNSPTRKLLRKAELSLRDALEQPEQEPAAWMREGWGPDCGPYVEFYRNDEMGGRDRNGWTPLYLHPPRREWQGLTDGDIDWICDWHSTLQGAVRAIEAALKERNHG